LERSQRLMDFSAWSLPGKVGSRIGMLEVATSY
jgi:hypothetical protein